MKSIPCSCVYVNLSPKTQNERKSNDLDVKANRQQYLQGPADIPDDPAKQLWVEPLAWGVCLWAPF
jgi:hypothetical protein